MEKEFKTIEQLVELLESRNVETDGDTAAILRRESYYAIVNGYKDSFLDRESMESSPGDVYKEGTTFKQIYDLFLFDRDVRSAIFPFLTKAEAIMKNAVVYAFCEAHPETESYLDRSNYVDAKGLLLPTGFRGNRRIFWRKNLNDLMSRLNGKIGDIDKARPFIKHYMLKYGAVPLWVLQNDLTFGNIEHFYQFQKRGVQNRASRIVGDVAGHGDRIGARDLLECFYVLVGFRNICAHGDRFYCADVRGVHADGMLDALFKVLPVDERIALVSSIGEVAERYAGRIDPRALNCMYSDKGDIPEEFA